MCSSFLLHLTSSILPVFSWGPHQHSRLTNLSSLHVYYNFITSYICNWVYKEVSSNPWFLSVWSLWFCSCLRSVHFVWYSHRPHVASVSPQISIIPYYLFVDCPKPLEGAHSIMKSMARGTTHSFLPTVSVSVPHSTKNVQKWYFHTKI